jgi:predicted TIM-barrel fold metal-dependent hydrolase
VANDLFAEFVGRHPERFRVFAALPLPHADRTHAEIERLRGVEHIVGFTIGCSVGQVQLDDPMLDPVLAHLDEVRAVVFLHPVGQEDTIWLAGHNVPWMVGAPFEDTVAALRLVLAAVPWRYPKIRFIVPHLGGTLPFLLTRVGRKRQGDVDVAAGLRTMFYDTVSGSISALKCACAEIDAHRLLFGTDYPYCDKAEFEHHLTYLDEAGLDDDTLQAIRGRTAAKLLGLGAPG